jgi:hypothetical protein
MDGDTPLGPVTPAPAHHGTFSEFETLHYPVQTFAEFPAFDDSFPCWKPETANHQAGFMPIDFGFDPLSNFYPKAL